jgi:methylaspartate ammonia-lyase
MKFVPIVVMFVVLALVFWVVTVELGRRARNTVMQAAEHRALAAVRSAQQARIVCQHCQTPGRVKTKPIMVKKGISGGKAAGALLTAGVSVIATGLSRKEATTQASCGNCGSTWQF